MKSALLLVIALFLPSCAQASPGATTLDETFAPVTIDQASDRQFALQPDGKILIAGNFNSVNGSARNSLARLNADGSLDTTFVPALTNGGFITSIGLQGNGKILVTGYGMGLLKRLNADGSLDESFNADVGIGKVVVGPANEIYIAGSGVRRDDLDNAHHFLAKIKDDGSVDFFADTKHWCGCGMAEDGIVVAGFQGSKIILAGYFSTDAGHLSLARFNPDGSEDMTFDTTAAYPDTYPLGVIIQSDAKILYASSTYGAGPVVSRFNADGSLDRSFTRITGLLSMITGFALDPGGKILISGSDPHNLSLPHFLARLNADGNIDTSFKLDLAYADVGAIAVQPDGRILLAGSFKIGPDAQPLSIIRLRGDPIVLNHFDITSETQITWQILDKSRAYTLESSDNLKTWTLIRTISPPAESIDHRESTSTQRFFRVTSN